MAVCAQPFRKGIHYETLPGMNAASTEKSSPLQPSECLFTLYHQDMEAARRFYGEHLGLALREATYDWYVGYWLNAECTVTLSISTSPDEYAQWGADGKGVVLDVFVSDVDAMYSDLSAKGVPFDHPPKDFPWGLRHARCVDPAGYRLNLTSYVPRTH